MNIRNLNQSGIALLHACMCLFFSAATLAHHGPNTNPALYLSENLIEFEGEVSGVLWRNPHPRILVTVTEENGEQVEWELEFGGQSASYLGDGIDGDYFNEGDPVRAAGVVSRRDPQSIGLLHLLLPNGNELVEGNRQPRWSDERIGRVFGVFTPTTEEIRAAEESADGIFRTWGRRIGGRPALELYSDKLTPEGREVAATFYAPRDNPELECRTAMPTFMFDPSFMDVRNNGSQIDLELSEYNMKRVIYMTEDRPDPQPSSVGYSVGRWEGDTLVVETTHIDSPYFDPYGTPQSNQMTYVETFRVADDDSQLDYTLVATDPVMFSEPVRLGRAWAWEPGRKIEEFDCVADWNG